MEASVEREGGLCFERKEARTRTRHVLRGLVLSSVRESCLNLMPYFVESKCCTWHEQVSQQRSTGYTYVKGVHRVRHLCLIAFASGSDPDTNWICMCWDLQWKVQCG
jgi:hypothetical protein